MTRRIIFLEYCKKNKYQNKKIKKKKRKNKTKKKQNKTKKKRKNKAKKEWKEIWYLQVFPSSPLTRVFVPNDV